MAEGAHKPNAVSAATNSRRRWGSATKVRSASSRSQSARSSNAR